MVPPQTRRKPARRGPLRDVELLKAIADPMRIRIGLLMLEEPKTVKELAAALEVPPTRLYYHVRMLESRGFIRVTSRRMVSGIEERRYQTVPEMWNVSQELASSALQSTGLLAALFAAVRADMEAFIEHSNPADQVEAFDRPMLMVAEVALKPGEVEKFRTRLEKLINSFTTERAGADGRHYRLFLAGYPSPGAPHA